MEPVELYARQEGLVSPPDTVHVIGCGGVGTWVAIMLALAGVKYLHLYEDDVLEETNLNRLPYTPDSYGKPKINLLAGYLTALRPNIELTLHGRFEPLLHKLLSGPVICAVDTIRDRRIVYDACQRDKVRYIDVGAEAHTCTVSDSPADWSFVEDRAGYFTPVWVAPVVMAAALAVSRTMYGYGLYGAEGTLVVDLLHEEIRRANEPKAQAAMVGQPEQSPANPRPRQGREDE